MMKLKFLLIGTCLSLIPNLTQAQCVAITDCATLGYTEKSCPNGKGLKCPFGTKYACPMTESDLCNKYEFKYACSGIGYAGGIGKACNNKYASCICTKGYEWENGKCEEILKETLGKCSGNAKNCKIGDALHPDGSCTTNWEAGRGGKMPIGVVVYIDKDNCGQAIALEDIGGMYWATQSNDEIHDLPSLDWPYVKDDFDSCGNTQKIIQAGTSSDFPAAWATVNYKISTPYTHGYKDEINYKWCLPAAGILYSIKKNLRIINESLKRIRAQEITTQPEDNQQLEGPYWSSSKMSNYAWTWNNFDDDVETSTTNNYYKVRPVTVF